MSKFINLLFIFISFMFMGGGFIVVGDIPLVSFSSVLISALLGFLYAPLSSIYSGVVGIFTLLFWLLPGLPRYLTYFGLNIESFMAFAVPLLNWFTVLYAFLHRSVVLSFLVRMFLVGVFLYLSLSMLLLFFLFPFIAIGGLMMSVPNFSFWLFFVLFISLFVAMVVVSTILGLSAQLDELQGVSSIGPYFRAFSRSITFVVASFFGFYFRYIDLYLLFLLQVLNDYTVNAFHEFVRVLRFTFLRHVFFRVRYGRLALRPFWVYFNHVFAFILYYSLFPLFLIKWFFKGPRVVFRTVSYMFCSFDGFKAGIRTFKVPYLFIGVFAFPWHLGSFISKWFFTAFLYSLFAFWYVLKESVFGIFIQFGACLFHAERAFHHSFWLELSASPYPFTLPLRVFYILLAPFFCFYFEFPYLFLFLLLILFNVLGIWFFPSCFMLICPPIFNYFWCLLADYRKKIVNSIPFRHDLSFSLRLWYANIYLLALPFYVRDDDYIIKYKHFGETLYFRVRDDLPKDPLQLKSLVDQLVIWMDPHLQDFFFAFLLIFVIFYILFYCIYKFFHTTVRLLYFVRRVLISWVLILLLPESFFVIQVSYLQYVFLRFDAFISSSDLFDNFKFQFKCVLSKLSLLVLFRISPYPDVGLDQVLQRQRPELRPEHRERIIDIVRRNVGLFWRRIDGLSLPEFIEAQYQPPSPENLRETYTTLRELGVPGITTEFIDSIQAPRDDPYLASWAGFYTHLRASTSFAFGPTTMLANVFHEMTNFLRYDIPGGIHTGTYNTIETEIESTSRYWTFSDMYHFPGVLFNDILDDVWELVSVQFADSRLTTFDYLYNRWVKKYNLGFGFSRVTRSGLVRSLSRRVAIASVGGRQSFLSLMALVFRYTPRLVHVSSVFAKMESLKLSKALKRSVRTIVGSSFTHFLMTSIWNYLPNHNYHIWQTPMKVGIRSNGYDFGRLWESVARHTFVWAGDMTAFDSQVPPVVIRIAAEIRKRGFEFHSDHSRICQLIDVAYDTLIKHPLGFRATGDVLDKEQGGTTGHSSTTPDNSIFLLTVYLFAWRRVTGLRAREFQMYNTLCNFGDDHILGWEPVFGWNPIAAARAMRLLSIEMRDEGDGQVFLPGKGDFDSFLLAYRSMYPSMPFIDIQKAFAKHHNLSNFPGQLKFSFLSKKPIPVSLVRDELLAAGIDFPYEYATIVDRDRLLMKIKAQIPSRSTPSQRRDRLISLMGLCAHLPDVYQQLNVSLRSLEISCKTWFDKNGGRKNPVPSYVKVLRDFYTKPNEVSSDVDEEEDFILSEGVDMHQVRMYGAPTALDYLVRWLADFPTFFSPRVVTNVWLDWFIRRFPHVFAWPSELHARSLSLVKFDSYVMRDLLARTPYSFLRCPDALTFRIARDLLSDFDLLFRHWIFMVFHFTFPRRPAPSFLAIFALLDKFFVNMYYVLFARIETVVVEVEVDFIGHFLIFLLSYVKFPLSVLLPEGYFHIFLPSPSRLVSYMYNYFVKYTNPHGAVDVQPLFAMLNAQSEGTRVLFSAPTGIGKSTHLLVRMQAFLARPVVCILPRALLVKSIVPYMQKCYPHLEFGAGVEGGFIPVNFDILYTTVQSMAAHQYQNRSWYYIMDEAHVDEPHYRVMSNHLTSFTGMYMTATPPEFLNGKYVDELSLIVSKRFNVYRDNQVIDDYSAYLRRALYIISSSLPGTRVLVFVQLVSEAFSLGSSCGRPFSVLSSKNTEISLDSEVFISTSVADAGLTIPDVSVVVTSNEDYRFSTSIGEGEVSRVATTTGVRYRLTENVLVQRVGRTGRTSDGVAYVFSLDKIRGGAISWTPADFVASLGPFVNYFYNSFPPSVRPILPPANTLTDASASTVWAASLLPFISCGDSLEEVVSEEHLSAAVTSALVNASKLYDPRLGQEFSYLLPSEISSSGSTGDPVLIPTPTRPIVFYFVDQELAELKFRQATGGVSLQAILYQYSSRFQTGVLELLAYLQYIDVMPFSFASMLFFASPKSRVWLMTVEDFQSPQNRDYISNLLKRYVQTAVGTASLDSNVFVPETPVRMGRAAMDLVHRLNATGNCNNSFLFTLASELKTDYVTLILFLSQNDDFLKILMIPDNSRGNRWRILLRRSFLLWFGTQTR